MDSAGDFKFLVLENKKCRNFFFIVGLYIRIHKIITTCDGFKHVFAIYHIYGIEVLYRERLTDISNGVVH